MFVIASFLSLKARLLPNSPVLCLEQHNVAYQVNYDYLSHSDLLFFSETGNSLFFDAQRSN